MGRRKNLRRFFKSARGMRTRLRRSSTLYLLQEKAKRTPENPAKVNEPLQAKSIGTPFIFLNLLGCQVHELSQGLLTQPKLTTPETNKGTDSRPYETPRTFGHVISGAISRPSSGEY